MNQLTPVQFCLFIASKIVESGTTMEHNLTEHEIMDFIGPSIRMRTNQQRLACNKLNFHSEHSTAYQGPVLFFSRKNCEIQLSPKSQIPKNQLSLQGILLRSLRELAPSCVKFANCQCRLHLIKSPATLVFDCHDLAMLGQINVREDTRFRRRQNGLGIAKCDRRVGIRVGNCVSLPSVTLPTRLFMKARIHLPVQELPQWSAMTHVFCTRTSITLVQHFRRFNLMRLRLQPASRHTSSLLGSQLHTYISGYDNGLLMALLA